METLIVTLKDKDELHLVSAMLKKMRITAKPLTKEDSKGLGISELMKQVDRSEKVSIEEVMKTLRTK